MTNTQALAINGYARAEFLGLDPAILCADAEPGAFGTDFLAAGDRTVQSRVHRTRKGEFFGVELSLTRVDLGEDAEQLCFATDVTERNELRRRVLETADLERRRLA